MHCKNASSSLRVCNCDAREWICCSRVVKSSSDSGEQEGEETDGGGGVAWRSLIGDGVMITSPEARIVKRGSGKFGCGGPEGTRERGSVFGGSLQD